MLVGWPQSSPWGWRISDRERTAITTVNTTVTKALGVGAVWQTVIAADGDVRDGGQRARVEGRIRTATDIGLARFPRGSRATPPG